MCLKFAEFPLKDWEPENNEAQIAAAGPPAIYTQNDFFPPTQTQIFSSWMG